MDTRVCIITKSYMVIVNTPVDSMGVVYYSEISKLSQLRNLSTKLKE